MERKKRVTTKPPYRVPTMQEINQLSWNGLTVISTFSGAGGSCLGYRMAGYKLLWASEFIPAAAEVYKSNNPTSILDTRDIRKVTPQEILEATNLKPGELDVLDGSPPCASFSTAGKREKGWGKIKTYSDTQQRADDLFFEYARILQGLQPRAFIAENVSGLVKGSAKGYFKLILARLKDAGYNVKAQLLDAQWLGVPQARQRLIFIGTRSNLNIEPTFPKPLPYRYSIREAIPWLADYHFDTSGSFGRSNVSLNTPAATVTVSGGAASYHHKVYGPTEEELRHVEPESSMDGYASGKAWDELRGIGQSKRYFQLVRPNPVNPSPTVTAAGGNASTASVAHPYERRKFSIAELKRICAFPDDYNLTGTYAQQWERLGRAVPPVMMKHIATNLQHQLKNN